MRSIVKISVGAAALGAGAVALDSGLGLLTKSDSRPEAIWLRAEADAQKRLIVLFHGYNGHGETLLEVLGPKLKQYGTVVAFAPGRGRFVAEHILDEADSALRTHRDTEPDTEVFVYGESLGGMLAADWLRRNPELMLEGWLLNATPGHTSHVLHGGAWVKLFGWLPGGPISTVALQLAQHHAMKSLPSLGKDVDKLALIRAYHRAFGITAPMVFGQAAYVANWRTPAMNEFAGRARQVRFVRYHTPGGHDGRIWTSKAAPAWGDAVGWNCFTEAIMSWQQQLHTPTAEQPQALLKQFEATFASVAA